MAAGDTIEILNVNHPGKTERINAAKYHTVREAMLAAVPNTTEGIALADLADAVATHLPGGELPGGGQVGWYTMAVKLDLEARGLIERIPGARPQRVRRVAARG